MIYNVLLVAENPQEIQRYSESIQGIIECEIKVIDLRADLLKCLEKARYHLAVLVGSVEPLHLLERIKRNFPLTATVLISAQATVPEAVAAIRLGAEDYLAQPVQMDLLQKAVQRGVSKNACFFDKSRSSEFLYLLNQMAYLDDATGLYNTRYLSAILEREISLFQVTHRSFAVLFVDADGFKSVNDRYGHLVGTKLLNELGNHLKQYVGERDTVFRYGGDEFVAVLSGCDLSSAMKVAEKIRESVARKSFLKSQALNIHFTVSIGVAIFPDHAKTQRQIIESADYAMYQAKGSRVRNAVFVSEKRF